MKKAIQISLLAGAAMVLAPMASVHAGQNGGGYGPQKVVHDTGGHVVKNTWGHCVVTNWRASHNECTEIDSELLAVYFDFNSSRLTPSAMAKLDQLISEINRMSSVQDVDIVGFADAIGSNDYNYHLSRKRANSVKRYLAQNGIDTRGVNVRGFGEDAPVSDCGGLSGKSLQDCLWRDRRVEIKLNYAH